MTFTLPPQLTFARLDATSATGWNCSTSGQVVTSIWSSPIVIGAAAGNLVLNTQVSSQLAGGAASGSGVALAAVGSGPSNSPDTNALNNQANATLNIVAGANVWVTKTVDATPIVATTKATFTLNVENKGPYPAQGLVLTDSVPAMFTNVVASGAGWDCSASAGNAVSCKLATLAVGASPVTVTATAPDNTFVKANPGSFSNTANVTTTSTDPDTSHHSSSLPFTFKAIGADLAIQSSRGSAPILPVTIGADINTSLSVVNNGPLAVSSNQSIYITYQLGADELFKSTLGGWSCLAAGGAGSLVTCSIPGAFTVGATTVTLNLVTVNTKAAVSLSNAVCTSTSSHHAPAESDINLANDCSNTAGQIVSTGSAKLSMTKVDITPSTAHTVLASESWAKYTLTVSNTGPSYATNVLLSDPIPMFVNATTSGSSTRAATNVSIASLSQGSCDPTSGLSESNNAVTCNLGTIKSGSSASVTIQVARPMYDGAQTNIASAYSSDVADLSGAKVTAQASVQIQSVTDVFLSQNAPAASSVVATTPVTYTVQAVNLGPSAAKSVKISDAFTQVSGSFTFAGRLLKFSPADTGRRI